MSARAPLLDASCRLYRTLLRVLPSSLRRRRGDEIVELFRDQLRGAYARRGARGALAVWARATLGLLTATLAGAPAGPPLSNLPSGDSTMLRILDDLRLAARALRRRPGFGALAILTLGVGIGAATAIFGLVHAVLIEPLPYPDSDRVVYLEHAAPKVGFDSGLNIAPGLHVHYADHARELEAIGFWMPVPAPLTGTGEPERVRAAQASSGLFEVLRARPLHGRLFLPEDDTPDSPRNVILGHDLWQRRYGADPAIVGRTIEIGGRPLPVVGVLPADFDPPGPDIELWLANARDLRADFGGFSMEGIGRLREGATVESLRTELDALIGEIDRTFPDPVIVEFLREAGVHSLARPLKEHRVGAIARTLWVLLGTVGLVLAVACANVGNLFLVRAEARRRETAVRVALGAGRGDLVRTFLAESLLLSGAAALVGVAIAAAGTGLLVRGAPVNIPRLAEVDLDPVVLAFAVGLAVVSSLVFGLAPALRPATAVTAEIREGGRSSTAGRGHVLARQALVAAQVALALVVLLGAGLMTRSFLRIQRIEPGFEPSGVLVFDVGLPGGRYPGIGDAARFHRELLERLDSLPGVASAGAAADVPLGGLSNGDVVARISAPPAEGELPPVVWINRVFPGLFATLGQPLIAGRTLTRDDDENGRPVAVVNETAARLLWPDADPVGDRVTIGVDDGETERVPVAIVGIVGDTVQRDLVSPTSPALFVPASSDAATSGGVHAMTYLLRTSVEPLSLAEAVRRTVWDADGGIPVVGLTTLEARIRTARAPAAFTLLLLGIAAGVATLLGCVGMYGVIAWIVRQRTTEIGIRIALGARTGDVVGMMLSQGLAVAATGLGAGLGASLLLSSILESLLYEVAPLDLPTHVAVVALLTGIVAVATWLPARRAARIDPSESLRQD